MTYRCLSHTLALLGCVFKKEREREKRIRTQRSSGKRWISSTLSVIIRLLWSLKPVLRDFFCVFCLWNKKDFNIFLKWCCDHWLNVLNVFINKSKNCVQIHVKRSLVSFLQNDRSCIRLDFYVWHLSSAVLACTPSCGLCGQQTGEGHFCTPLEFLQRAAERHGGGGRSHRRGGKREANSSHLSLVSKALLLESIFLRAQM